MGDMCLQKYRLVIMLSHFKQCNVVKAEQCKSCTIPCILSSDLQLLTREIKLDYTTIFFYHIIEINQDQILSILLITMTNVRLLMLWPLDQRNATSFCSIITMAYTNYNNNLEKSYTQTKQRGKVFILLIFEIKINDQGPLITKMMIQLLRFIPI